MVAAVRGIRLVTLAAWRSALEQWIWRGFLVTIMLEQAIAPIIGYLVWRSIDPGSQAVLTYFFALLIVQLATVSFEDHTLATAIYTGDLADELLRPQPTLVPYLGANLSLRFWHLAFGLPLIVAVGVTAHVPLDLGTIAAFVPAVILAGALRFVFTTTIATCAFWTERAQSIVGVANTVLLLLGGAAAPVFLLDDRLAVVAHLLPFWPMLGFPAEVAAGLVTAPEFLLGIAAQALWLAVFAVAARLAWARGLRTYTAIGA